MKAACRHEILTSTTPAAQQWKGKFLGKWTLRKTLSPLQEDLLGSAACHALAEGVQIWDCFLKWYKTETKRTWSCVCIGRGIWNIFCYYRNTHCYTNLSVCNPTSALPCSCSRSSLIQKGHLVISAHKQRLKEDTAGAGGAILQETAVSHMCLFSWDLKHSSLCIIHDLEIISFTPQAPPTLQHLHLLHGSGQRQTQPRRHF